MFYIVKLGDKKYYSKEFVKNVRKLGDAGIVREIEKGTLKTRKILSMVVYELDDKEVSNINLTEAGVQTQDLKETVKNFKAATEVSVKLCSAGNADVLEESSIGKYKFVELRNILFAKKYVYRDSLPCLDVCGVRYVALNTTRKDADKYISD